MREWQYVWNEYFTHMQAALCGTADIQVHKAGLWNWIKTLPQKFVGKLGNRTTPTSDVVIKLGPLGPDYDEADSTAWEWLQKDWNEVYTSENYKGAVLGMIATELLSRGVDLNDLKDMSLNDLDDKLQENGYAGLDDVDDYLEKSGWKKDQYYAHIWQRDRGAEWLAVYNDQGQRAGRAYEVITQMYRDILAQAIEEDAPIDKIRQRLLYANDSSIKAEFQRPDGTLDEAAYQNFIDRHLNRDMVRFAVTETAIAYNNGKLLQMLHEKQEYVVYSH
jgi:hypothetical protein